MSYFVQRGERVIKLLCYLEKAESVSVLLGCENAVLRTCRIMVLNFKQKL
jgi:hypothetical protein